LWYWDAYLRVKVDHYANVVRRWGVPEGIGRLTQRQARQRHRSYKLWRRAGRVEGMEIVNGSGHPTPVHSDVTFMETRDFSTGWERQPECRYEYHRNEKGKLLEVVARDRAGGV